MQIKKKRVLVWIALIAILIFAVFTVFKSNKTVYDYSSSVKSATTEVSLAGEFAEKTQEEDQEALAVKHLPTPSPLKAIYMTSCVAGTPSFREELVALIEETELNSVVVDIKDYTGTLSYKPSNPEILHAWEEARCGTSDMREFVEGLHEKDIYVIGRVTVFQDPHLTSRRPDLAVKFASTGEVWKDNKGLSFTDVSAKEVWDYHIAIAKDAYDIGFDEINFDYIRFPSDGPMSDIYFPFTKSMPKPEALERFFEYLHNNLKDTGMITSADLFGMTTTNKDDLNIGQVLERAMPYFDYIAPMVYPSHYPKGFNNWSNPNHHPYELIKFVMSEAVERTVATKTPVKTLYNEPIYEEEIEYDEEGNVISTKEVFSGFYKKPVYDAQMMRPWLQDFKYGGDYGPAEVRAQIQATYDSGLDSWMLWAPSNRYTRDALLTN